MRPDDIQNILASKVHIDKSPFYNIMQSYMGNSIVLANGEEWHNKRKLLNPFFHLNVIERLFVCMSEGGRQLCDLLETKAGEGINITSHLNNCVDQILNCKCPSGCRLSFSISFHPLSTLCTDQAPSWGFQCGRSAPRK